MTVPNVGTSDANSVWQQRKQDFSSLESAIESGNIQGAQSSLATLQQDAASANSSSNNTDQFTSGFAQVVSAVQSGNLTAAQQALTQLQTTMKAQGGHHHHHHGGGSASSTSSMSSTSSTPATEGVSN